MKGKLGTAIFSEDRLYRYTLDRQIGGEKGLVTWVCLNPSTATADIDDPTIRRCIGFSRAWGYSKMRILNVYAFRATDPKNMLAAKDPVGPDNDAHIRATLVESELVVCAWGTKAGPRALVVKKMIVESGKEAYCLGTTKDGYPKHPLYLAANTQLVEF